MNLTHFFYGAGSMAGPEYAARTGRLLLHECSSFDAPRVPRHSTLPELEALLAEIGIPVALASLVSTVCASVLTAKIETLVSQGYPPVVLCAPQVRLQVRRMLEGRIPQVAVLSYNEIVKEVPVESHGTVLMEKAA